MDSEKDAGSPPDEDEKKLHELTARFLTSRDPDAPDPKVVRGLYMATFTHIVKHLAKGVRDRELAEDAAHEAFKALQAHLGRKGSLPNAPMKFLLTVARNFLRKEGRNRRRRRNVPIDDVDSQKLDLACLDAREDAREPVEQMQSTELKAAATPAVEALDPLTRKIIELRRKGLEWDEVARRAGVANGEIARKKFDEAVEQVKEALAQKFSSCVTTAGPEARRWVKSRKSASQAIDLLPPPYNKVLHLLLEKKMTEREVAEHLGVSPGEVKRHHERAVEIFHDKYKMTEDELLDVLWHGKGALDTYVPRS